MVFYTFYLDWIAKLIEDKGVLLKKCEDIFGVLIDKTDVLDFLWDRVWELVWQTFIFCFFSI